MLRRQHHMLKRVLNSGREKKSRGACWLICFVCLDSTRDKVEGRAKRTEKYIYIKFYK